MLLYYYLKCRKNTESKNSKVGRMENGRIRTENGRIRLLSKCAVYDSNKSKFFK